jgi:hypothetical protein
VVHHTQGVARGLRELNQQFAPEEFAEVKIMRSIRHLSIIMVGIAVSAPRVHSEERLTQGVTANTRIVSQRYCAVDEEVATLGLTLSTTLVNHGNIHFEVGENFYPKILVARTLRDSRMGRYEREQHGPEKIVSDPRDKRAEYKSVKLAPGQSVESTSEVFVAVPIDARNVPKYALPPGRHYLQAEVQVLVSQEGHPKYSSVVSPPVAFYIKENPQTQNCMNGDSTHGVDKIN